MRLTVTQLFFGLEASASRDTNGRHSKIISNTEVSMANHPPYSLVLTYTEDPKQLIMQAVDSTRLAPLVSGLMEVPIFLDDDEFKFDDELARQLGVAALNVIALGRPDLKQYLSVTQHPLDRPLGK